jgi:hypothetical protein
MDESSHEKGGRSEKSLSTLTRKFVELLKEDREVDLNVVSGKAKVSIWQIL